MNSFLQVAFSLCLVFSVTQHPDQVKVSDLSDFIEPVVQSFQHEQLDSCNVAVLRLLERCRYNIEDVTEAEFNALFDLLEGIDPDSGSFEETLLTELEERTRQAYSEYLQQFDILPEDVDPSFIWNEMDIQPAREESETGWDEDLELIPGLETADSIAHSRGLERLPDIEFVDNAKVRNAIKYFQTRGRKVMQIWLDRSAEMIPVLLPILREEGMPDDLVYLAMIESGFKTNAYSWAHAAGPWQFISSTGRNYGLEVDWWYDERRDPELSTRAAATYLRDLYNLFDNWYLAMAAYNCGEGKIKRHVRSYGADFWKLRRIPRQTRNYVPSYIAATMIASSPEEYGFTRSAYLPVMQTDSIIVKECVDLKEIARCAETDFETIKKLNPAIVRWCTPPGRDSTVVRIPEGTDISGFWEKYASIPPEKKVSYIRHRVRSGETLSVIAARYGVPQWLIANHPQNGIRNRHRIKAGQMLVIPGISSEKAKYASKRRREEPVDIPTDGSVHTVRRGETLSEIAELYGTSVSRLKRLNNLYGKRFIYPGQKVMIDKKLKPASSNKQIVQKIEKAGDRYTVKRGDTLWIIAQKYGVSLDRLRSANGLEHRTLIKPGQKLIIPSMD